MSLIEDISGIPKRNGQQAASIKDLTQPQKTAVERDVEQTLVQLALQQSTVHLDGSASFEPEETTKSVSVTVKPVLRSVDVETGDDVSVVAQRLVGGEVKFTLRF